MPLIIQCINCQKSFSFPALEKKAQSGRCPDCERHTKVEAMSNEINQLQVTLDSIRPTLYQLNQTKYKARADYEKAEAAWADLARKHASINKKLAIITHERDILTKKKEVISTKVRQSKTAEELALQALKNLPASTLEALLKQIKENQS